MKPTLVTCYVNPDLDGTAGAIGYAEFLQKHGMLAVAGTIGEPHEEAQYMFTRFGFAKPLLLSHTEDFEKVILVDASDLGGLEGKVAPEKVIEIIDHRKIHQADKFPNAKTQIELVGATATLVAEKFMHANTEISVPSTTLLYGAIISNTLNFKATVTTDRDRKTAAWLNETAKLPEHFWKELFMAKSDLSGNKLSERIYGDFNSVTIGQTTIGIAQIEMIGAKKLMDERKEEAVKILNALKKEKQWDMVFQSTIDLEESKNYLLTDDPKMQQLLEKALNVTFNGMIAERKDVLMRKQIIPLLIDALEYS